jgi:hypothetical protein
MTLCNSCNPDDGDKDEIDNPVIPDPEGTVSLDMSNPLEKIDGRIYLEEGNFNGALFTTLGKVRGLGDVTTIPKTGWVSKIAAIEGHGYIAYYNNQYWRLFVSAYNSAMTGTTRAIVKFQRPFPGSEKEIKLKTGTVTLDDNSSNYQIVEFTNESLFPFTVTVPQSANWITASSATTDNATPPNIVRIAPREKNPTMQSREGTITVKSDIGKEIPIKVMQAGGESWITVEGNYGSSIYLSGTGTATVQVRSNDQWTATSSENWCTVSPNFGNGNGTVTINATENTTGTSRNTVVTLTTKDNKAKVELNAVQSGSSLSVSRNSISFSAPASQNTFTVSSNASWTATSDKDWCTVVTNNNTVTVSVSENLSGTDRNATVTVAVSEELKTMVNISQAKATLSVSRTSISFTGIQSQNSFTVTSNVSWTVTSDQAWCSATKNNNQVTVSATENLSGTARTATIKVVLSEQHYTTVTVTQDVPTLDISKTALSFPKTPANQETITVTSNVSSWNVVSNSSWCTASKSGNNVTVSVSQNNTGILRQATVTISLPGNVKAITVSQAAYDVGDFYNVTGIQGIVYKLTEVGHGMIVSLDETQKIWSSVQFSTGANSNTDGLYNMGRIKLLDNWSTRYLAFAWCDAKNTGTVTGWYLPALNELNDIYSVFGLVNEALSNNGGVRISSDNHYWSSTEYSSLEAWSRIYQSHTNRDKSYSRFVRAVKSF